MINRTVDEVRQVMLKKGYKFFENGNYNLNIIGERKENGRTNEFDDTIHLIYRRTGDEDLTIQSFPITTEPGSYWLHNPFEGGTAILVPGQYQSTYMIRKHQGKYDAVCQKHDKKVKVYRDKNKDNVLDMNAEDITEGIYGINIHRSNPYSMSTTVDKWSAGCQVFSEVTAFDHFMFLANRSKTIWGNSFTYTLLEEKDFN